MAKVSKKAKTLAVKECMKLPKEVLQIDRKGYSIYFMKADDEQKMNDLRGTGKVIGQVVYDSPKTGDQGNEVIVVVRSSYLENK